MIIAKDPFDYILPYIVSIASVAGTRICSKAELMVPEGSGVLVKFSMIIDEKNFLVRGVLSANHVFEEMKLQLRPISIGLSKPKNRSGDIWAGAFDVQGIFMPLDQSYYRELAHYKNKKIRTKIKNERDVGFFCLSLTDSNTSIENLLTDLDFYDLDKLYNLNLPKNYNDSVFFLKVLA